MICLSVAETTGSPLYLDIHHRERRLRHGRPLHALSATLGDGSYEGEVLLEISDRVEVTLVDEWLDPSRLAGLFSRMGREEIVRLLLEAAATLIPGVGEAGPEGRRGAGGPALLQACAGQLELPLRVAEETGPWHQAA